MKRLLCLIACVNAHMMWLYDSCLNAPGCTQPKAVATFAESAGSAGPLALLETVKNRTVVQVRGVSGTSQPTNLTLAVELLGEEGAGLTANIPVSPPFLMQLSTTYGIYQGKLLMYTASASEPTRPSDWLAIQSADTASGLEISVRDPFMSSGVAGEGVLAPPLPTTKSPGDQCPPGLAWHNGDACVVAVVRFNGRLLDAAVNISTYVSEDGEAGTLLRTSVTSGGVTVLRLPPAGKGATFYYAQVNYVEAHNGTYNGTSYTAINRWATTSAILQRPPTAQSPPPPSPASPPPPSIPPYPIQPNPPSPPPPEPIPPWVVRQLSNNSFGGAFGAIFLWLVLGTAGFGAYRAYNNRNELRAALGGRARTDMTQGMLGESYQPSTLGADGVPAVNAPNGA